MDQPSIESLFDQERQSLHKLRDIVTKTIDEEKLIVENLLHPPEEVLTPGQRVSDKVARFGGSWKFIISFLLVLIVWVVFNVSAPISDRFDQFPFILMNLMLSMIAALQAPIIMMSQNRQEEKDRKRAQNDYLVNLKAEIEIRSLQQKMDLLLEDQLKVLYDIQLQQLELLKEIKEQR